MEKNLLLRRGREMFLIIGTMILMVAYFYIVRENAMSWLRGWVVAFLAELILVLSLNPHENYAGYNRVFLWCMLAWMIYVLAFGYVIEAYSFKDNELTAIYPAAVIICTGVTWLVGRAIMMNDRNK